jgi:hypothetical protein
MAAQQLVLPGFHDPRLLVLSVLISILGAYAPFLRTSGSWVQVLPGAQIFNDL